jgi:hypothetical protein
MSFNPINEIMRYRRMGDPLLYLDTSEARQLRVLCKYPSLIEKIKNEGKYPLIDKGSRVLNHYRKPFSYKRWKYSWIEQFWIILYAHVVSAREAARMIRAIDGQGIRKLSARHIKNQMEPVIRFWSDFFKYIPFYLGYLNMIGRIINYDPELFRLDQHESGTKTNDIVEESGLIHQKVIKNKSSTNEKSVGQVSKKTGLGLSFCKVPSVSREMILVRHPNSNYKREMDEFRKGLRREMPKRKTSSCYFDAWKQSPEILGALIKKRKICI